MTVQTLDPSIIRAILLDIEGTTTPVTFVCDVLFPYARARLRAYLEAHATQPEIIADIAALRREHSADAQRAAENPSQNPTPPPWPDNPARITEHAATFALWLMDRDRKSTPLKSLQGRIWQAGYESGELRGQLYPDVVPALARWRRHGRRIAIFSSGSVQAQQLLFRHSTAGDLTLYLDAFFDTTTGPKQQPESYLRIAAKMTALGAPASGLRDQEQNAASAPSSLPKADVESAVAGQTKHPFGLEAILFISDIAAELDAARAAGLHTALCVRPGSTPPSHSTHPVIHDFDAVLP